MSAVRPVWVLHPRVFHYTSQAGLFGILESGRLWASHFGSLNDLTEFQTVTPILQRELFTLAKHLWETGDLKSPTGDSEQILALIKAGTDALPNIFWKATFADSTFSQPYIASFCGTHPNEFIRLNGLLSQWRGYGNGGGYVIEFETVALDQMAKSYSQEFSMYGLFAGVIYEENSPNFEEFTTTLQKFLKIVPIYGFTEWLVTAPETGAMQEALKLFIQLASRLKHRAFSEEGEVRIVVMRLEKEATLPLIPLKFRSNNGSIVPYIELFEGIDIRTAIRRVIVGPHHRKEERAEAVRILLATHNIHADVAISKIPLRIQQS